MSVDWNLTAEDYANYRVQMPDIFFEQMTERGWVKAGNVLVDLGTGPGTIARGFAKRGCTVTALDVADRVLEEAKRLDREAGVQIEYRVAPAEKTGLPDSFADVVTACQCWHWFDSQAAAREMRRVLRPGGTLLVFSLNENPLPGSVVEATSRLIDKYSPNRNAREGFFKGLRRELSSEGFTDEGGFLEYVILTSNHEQWRGSNRASNWIGASLPPSEVKAFDRDLAELLRQKFPEPQLQLPFYYSGIVARKI